MNKQEFIDLINKLPDNTQFSCSINLQRETQEPWIKSPVSRIMATRRVIGRMNIDVIFVQEEEALLRGEFYQKITERRFTKNEVR